MTGNSCWITRSIAIAIPLLFCLVPGADAKGPYATAWTNYYDGSPGPASQSLANIVAATGKTCQLCHETSSGGGTWNGYGWALRAPILGGMSPEEAFAVVEAANSDGDPAQPPLLPSGWSNLLEIQFDGQPGWTYGNNDIYDGDGTVVGTATPPAGLSTFQIDPNPTVPAKSTTWGRLKRLYGE